MPQNSAHVGAQTWTLTHICRTTAVVCMIIKMQHRMSYRELASPREMHPDMFRMCRLKKTPSKSKLHTMSEMIMAGDDFMHNLLRETIGRSAFGNMATRLGLARMDDSTMYSTVTVPDSSMQMHILANPDGAIVEFEATKGAAGDSPAFQRVFVRLPKGSEIVALDAAYDSKANCTMIVRNGRVPVIHPRKNARCNGYDARAKMCQWAKNRPGEFERAYGIRNNIQSIFSSIKKRIGAFVRARSLPARTVEIFAMILCHNMTV